MAEEEGILDRTARAAKETTEKLKLVAEIQPKLGLSGTQMAGFMAKADAARSGQKIPELYKKNPSGYDGLLKALGNAYKKDGDILSKLDAEMAGTTGLEERFYKAIRKEPNAFAAKLENYKSGDIKAFVEESEKASPSPVALVAGAKEEITRTPKEKAAGPAAAQPAAVKPKAKKPAVVGAAVASGAVVADEGDAEVKGLAMGVEAYVLGNFPELQTQAAGFRGAITGNPKLQRAIAARLAADPAFKTELLGAMSSRTPMDPKMKDQMRPFLARVLDNPEALGDEAGFARTKKDFAGTKSALSMAGVNEWFQGNFGINLNGILGKIGGFFQQLFGQIGQIFNGFSNGGFKSMRNGGQSMMGAFNLSMQEATLGAERDAMDIGNLRAYSPARNGKFYHTEVTQDANGNNVSRNVMDTVEIRTINGSVHKVPLSSGLHSVRKPDGSYELSLASKVDEKGGVTAMSRYVVSPEEGAKYYAQLRQAGSSFVDQNFGGGTPTQGHQPAVVVPRNAPSPSVQRYDAQTGVPLGIEDVTIRARPLPPKGPQSPASNDPEMHLRNQG